MTNSETRYGKVARFFHWTIALLILSDIGSGLYAGSLPRDADTLDTLKTIFSIHKTVGVIVLGLAILRVIWAMTQPRPVPLHPERRLETFAAETVHWALYGAIFMMPLSGWVMHSALVGFSPILWPFGQDLPLVPKSEAVAHAAGTLHWLSSWVIYIVVGVHVVGALKHVVIDRDDTLARMTRGVEAGTPGTAHGNFAPVVALVFWVAVLWVAVLGLALMPKPAPETNVQAGLSSEITGNEATQSMSDDAKAPAWAVTDGQLTFTVTYSGTPIQGAFEGWQAVIAYDPATGRGRTKVMIDVSTLSLGAIGDVASGRDFFDVENHASAVFEADIERLGNGPLHKAKGTLTVVGQSMPVTLDFALETEGATATMQGSTRLDRRDFGMGKTYEDESTVSFGVDVSVSLTAQITQ